MTRCEYGAVNEERANQVWGTSAPRERHLFYSCYDLALYWFGQQEVTKAEAMQLFAGAGMTRSACNQRFNKVCIAVDPPRFREVQLKSPPGL